MQFKKGRFKVLSLSENNQLSKKKIRKQLLSNRFCKSTYGAQGEHESSMLFCGKQLDCEMMTKTFKTWEAIPVFCSVLPQLHLVFECCSL